MQISSSDHGIIIYSKSPYFNGNINLMRCPLRKKISIVPLRAHHSSDNQETTILRIVCVTKLSSWIRDLVQIIQFNRSVNLHLHTREKVKWRVILLLHESLQPSMMLGIFRSTKELEPITDQLKFIGVLKCHPPVKPLG
mmetsp:Transcript_5088/g.7470  ORF Transcript_5088/g.7470 Transcript_5088/m.7470 type:complete len:139 (+) Transcript_5088:243-659(+)